MAEAIFKHQVKEQGYEKYFKLIDSFGTSGWHIGDSPDSRSAKTCRRHGVPVSHSAQQISSNDFKNFDYIIGMDKSNLQDLKFMKPENSNVIVEIFGHWNTPNSQYQDIVDDPYYGGIDGFEYNFNQICHFTNEFLKREIGVLE
ncbi:unnamed protein product [Candida verbasci]|uniref:Phosphotyrosine protein phosphatase I domain-containing protein n=1 Tax=Candida verbasci TaxID=1227364 RepID=A0A9W4TU11_9ASCO|nr:unnamed protein product [Candida verbasci]